MKKGIVKTVATRLVRTAIPVSSAQSNVEYSIN